MFTIVSVNWYKMPQAYHCHSALLSTFYFLSFLHFPFFYSFSKFQFYITVLSIVSMLYIRSQTLFIFSLKVCMFLPNFLYFPQTPVLSNHFSTLCFYTFFSILCFYTFFSTLCFYTFIILDFTYKLYNAVFICLSLAYFN